ncbi:MULTISPECIES: amidase [Hyphomicrobiales]|jgi:fatty acid amide hydrolase 2|uniref:Amidase domain-containing protein n=1 Tax=Methylorubrum populi TaxID=223967 RepID=A0A160PN09_9HYPH|nr:MULTISPECIES: amidase [Hyphomicrobiales]MDH0699700.1 amidase [Agrobacterium sp. GD03871]MDH1062556.1 amidase [Agrobacterium sp. GD03992]MDH2228047.1 amidase [Agrobacterium sp. GD03642]BAU94173.1 hypothetical protein MPPM_5568 [Methylorubrum populi]
MIGDAATVSDLCPGPPFTAVDDGCSIARAVASGELQAVDLAEAALGRLRRSGPRLGALAWLNEDQARSDAKAADRVALQDGMAALSTHPLLGLPITVKEGLRVAGAPWMMGSCLNRNRVAQEDGSVVARLRAAGAVIVGLGSMAEMALWPETVNRLTGRALHPQNPTRTPGGSSGGDAALVAAGAVTAAMGADGGGSVRIPAAYCGLFAHKPSAGAVPLTGHTPMDQGSTAHAGALAQFFTPGPITKSARDLWPLLKVVAGADGIQPGLSHDPLREAPSAATIAGKTVYLLPQPTIWGSRRFDPSQVAAIETAARHLETWGASVKEVRADLLRDAFLIWLGTLRSAADFDLGLMIGNGSRVKLIREASAQFVGRGTHTAAGLILAFAARVDQTGPRYWKRWSDRGKSLADELSAMLAPDALLICPPVPGAAPRHNRAFLYPFDIASCAIFNALGNPATVAPIAMGREGLPRAVQIVAHPGGDHLSISAALALELSIAQENGVAL